MCKGDAPPMDNGGEHHLANQQRRIGCENGDFRGRVKNLRELSQLKVLIDKENAIQNDEVCKDDQPANQIVSIIRLFHDV